MSKKVRHVLGISGGKDSAALAIYMKQRYPQLDLEYYTCDTGKELDETYELIKNLEIYLGKKILRLSAAEGSNELPFDHFLRMYGGFLPSSNSRWCTKKLKLEPFEQFVGNDPVVSYVGIRGDEEREGYISRKQNIQSIFPFRRNIWSEDVVGQALANHHLQIMLELSNCIADSPKAGRIVELLGQPIGRDFLLPQKVNMLLDLGVKEFNTLVFTFLQTTNYPLSGEPLFPLVDNEDVLVRQDIFTLLEKSGVGVPAYYEEVPYTVAGKSGSYARSRSGCFFCFFQQKIEWIWLYEQHPDLFAKAMAYEKEGYTWMQDEKLEDLLVPARMNQIKADFIQRKQRQRIENKDWKDLLLDEAEEEGCLACFL